MRRIPELLSCVRGSGDWNWLIPAYLGVSDLSYPVTFHTRSGDSITLETFHDLVTTWVIFFRHEYTVLESDKHIIDVGANIGVFALYAARCAPNARIVALEPFPETRLRLVEQLDKNGLRGRVECRDYGLAGTDSTRRMADDGGPSQSRGFLASDTTTGVEVKAVSLRTLLGEESGSPIDLLKVDIEGAEHEAFSGIPVDAIRRVRRISLEYHPNGSKEKLFGELIGAGFQLERDMEAGVNSGVAEFSRVPVDEMA